MMDANSRCPVDTGQMSWKQVWRLVGLNGQSVCGELITAFDLEADRY